MVKKDVTKCLQQMMCLKMFSASNIILIWIILTPLYFVQTLFWNQETPLFSLITVIFSMCLKNTTFRQVYKYKKSSNSYRFLYQVPYMTTYVCYSRAKQIYFDSDYITCNKIHEHIFSIFLDESDGNQHEDTTSVSNCLDSKEENGKIMDGKFNA